jgi:hypothetical protein
MRDALSRREQRSFTARSAKLLPGLFEMGEIHQGNAAHRNKPKEMLVNKFHYKNKEKEDNQNLIAFVTQPLPSWGGGQKSITSEPWP